MNRFRDEFLVGSHLFWSAEARQQPHRLDLHHATNSADLLESLRRIRRRRMRPRISGGDDVVGGHSEAQTYCTKAGLTHN